MTNQKSSNSKTDRSVVSAMQRTLLFGISGATVLTTTLAVVFAIALDGCTSKPKNTNSSSSSQSSSKESSSKESVQAKEISPLPGLPIGKSSAIQTKTSGIKKDSAVQRPSTVTYTDSRYGVSFRYPRKYTLMTASKTNAAWPDPLPMNFLQPGGVTVAAIDLAGPDASSLLKVSVNKGLTSEQCGKFAVPEISVNGNSPVDSHDDSLSPSKVNIRGVEFFEVENITDNVEARYYHRFEPGKTHDGIVEQSNCYEFALGVEESPDNPKPVDHLELFDKLEKILSSAKFKNDLESAVAANLPVKTTDGINPQQ